MKKTVLLTAVVAAALCAHSATLSLDGTWEFSKNGGAFEKVTVPHDWAIAGPFNPEAPCGSGKLPWQGYGEYRRTFTAARAEKAFLVFDGVMAWPEVLLNGKKVGGWDFGYMSFRCDVTDALKDGENEVVVKADTRPHQSRWYPGGGLYRSVRLETFKLTDADPETVVITTSGVAEGRRGEPGEKTTDATAVVHFSYETFDGRKVAFDQHVHNPVLWSDVTPHLYEYELCGRIYRYGIRTIEWTADDGFHLNGERVQIQGVNLHSDLGPLGMAFNVSAAKRQLRIMKDMGVNAIRTSHNAPDPKFLDLCDEMGFLVWDECFDKWDETAGRKPEQELEEFAVRNLRQFVKRDRNHPSVIAWSVANEIAPVGDKYGKPSGMTRARNKLFADTVRAIDPTRPVGSGNASVSLLDGDFLEDFDISGWNYWHRYADFHRKYPKVPVVMTESASALSNYGSYRTRLPQCKVDFSKADMECDGFDHQSAWGGDIADIELYRVWKDKYLAGEFVWTGIDYLGEPNPFAYVGEPNCWPNDTLEEKLKPRSSYFGIVDLCGIPKDRFYLYRSVWNTRDETVHILPHWNWTAGDKVPVFVYTSGDEAELFLNGRSLGRRAKVEDPNVSLDPAGRWPAKAPVQENPYYKVCEKYRLRWFDVPYEPGELKAVAYRKGEKIGEAAVRTAGAKAKVRLAAGTDVLPADGVTYEWVEVDVTDAKGVRDPLATDFVSFKLTGPGEIVAVGNADPHSYKSFKDVSGHPLYYGKCVAVVARKAGSAEPITLTASASGRESASLTFDLGENEYDFRKELVKPYGKTLEERIPQKVTVKVDPSLGERKYEIDVGDAEVRIAAGSDRAAAQAKYHLEDLLDLYPGQPLKKGREVRESMFSPRMIHSGYGIDVFPDEYLHRMARHGFDAILVFIKEAGCTAAGPSDVNDLIRRAAKWGIDTYLYSYVQAPVHPDDPKAEEVFRRTFGAVAHLYPEAKGYIFVGESCHFPSKDPRTNGKAWPAKPEPGDTRPYPGMFPCSDYPDWLSAAKKAIDREHPNSDIVFWTYNFGRLPAEVRLPLLKKMPKDVSMLVTFEMYENSVKRNGMKSRVWDYSLSDEGPGFYFTSEAECCAQTGLRLYTQANTAGRTWDLGSSPYLPCPYQWKRRWDRMVEAHEKYGLSGLMEGHHYGWYPSFITELSKEAFTKGGIPFEEHIRAIAARDFGAGNVERVLKAWQALSDVIRDSYPCPQNLAGPYRIGPAFPFNFFGPRISYDEFPYDTRSNYFKSYCWTYLNYMDDFAKSRFPPVKKEFDVPEMKLEIELLRDMTAKCDAAAETFAAIAASASGEIADRARHESTLAAYMGCCYTTVRHLREGAIATLAGDRAKVWELAKAEYANKRRTLGLVRRDSRLGGEPSMEYTGGAETIKWSMHRMEKVYGISPCP